MKPKRVFLALFIILVFALNVLGEEKSKWMGIDETVVEKISAEHGREASEPLINTDQGDLLLFLFLLAGAVGGFAAGYYFRVLMEAKLEVNKQVLNQQRG